MDRDWSKSHNGIMLCTFEQTRELMPEVMPMLDELIPHLEHDVDEYVVDVKIHMLMPGEYPCIPNWHLDFVPRDKDRKKIPSQITGDKMYLWVSGAPYTEFKKDPVRVETGEFTWAEFTQRDLHRGVKSEIHTWRCFIRVIPKKFIHLGTLNVGTIRRHTQVYIEEPDLFRW
jgi:hypothetical protein